MPQVRFPLVETPAPLRELPIPDTLTFFLGRPAVGGPLLSPAVGTGDPVAVGQRLGRQGDAEIVPSPAAGTVALVTQAPNIRGGRPGLAVVVAPASNGTPEPSLAPSGLRDPEDAPVDELRERLREAGVAVPDGAGTLVVVAADTEPGLSSTLRLLADDPGAAVRAARVVARASGARRVALAVLPAWKSAVQAASGGTDLEVLVLPPEYPATLPAVVARSVAGPGCGPVAVVALPDALAAWTVVETGRPPSDRMVTVLGPGLVPVANYRVPLGTSLRHVLSAAGLDARPGDKVVTGGPLRGLAQYSLDSAVDVGVDGLLLVREGAHATWADEPCVNCGDCLPVCPERLPAHLLVRFAEFNLFDSAAEHGLDRCIECGLCATVCPARRPMLQRIRLAKREVAAAAKAEALAVAIEGVTVAREPDPIPVPVAASRKD